MALIVLLVLVLALALVKIYEVDQNSGERDIHVYSTRPPHVATPKQKPPAPAGDGGFLITA
ncbi:MAG TPA: hypothetical protein VF797_02125 [Noviherbaspirillum sp.]